MAAEQQAAAPALQPHQQRMLDEKAQLDPRVKALQAFVETPLFASLDSSEQFDQHDQLNAMERYQAALGRRIARFQGTAA